MTEVTTKRTGRIVEGKAVLVDRDVRNDANEPGRLTDVRGPFTAPIADQPLPILPDAAFLTITSITLAALDATARPGIATPWIQALEGHVERYGRFSKFAVAYLPAAPPPFFWSYTCLRCRFWTEPNGCTLVNGFIAAGGWCAVWMPPEKDKAKPFAWPAQVLQDAPRWLKEAPQALTRWIDDRPIEITGLVAPFLQQAREPKSEI